MKKILFVCTGNICRSPMAEGFFRELMKERGDFEALSAGLAAVDGQPPSAHAVTAMKELGLDISALGLFPRPALGNQERIARAKIAKVNTVVRRLTYRRMTSIESFNPVPLIFRRRQQRHLRLSPEGRPLQVQEVPRRWSRPAT
ncbi:MAG: hypothetical protein VB959_13445 [Rhodospirillales bacterium]